jgi:hypothetical protein
MIKYEAPPGLLANTRYKKGPTTLPFDHDEIWDLMRSGIEHFQNSADVTNALKALDDGQFADPLFHFCFEKCGDELDLLALLNNWYCVTTPIGTLGDNIDYAQKCYDGVIKNDPTLRKLFCVPLLRAAVHYLPTRCRECGSTIQLSVSSIRESTFTVSPQSGFP